MSGTYCRLRTYLLVVGKLLVFVERNNAKSQMGKREKVLRTKSRAVLTIVAAKYYRLVTHLFTVSTFL